MATKATKSESTTDKYGSTILGFIVVLVLGIFLFNVFRGNDADETNQGDIGDSANTAQDADDGQKRHTVEAGDTLWSISEQYYGTGFNWQDIVDANTLANPDQVEKGTVLIIPNIAKKAEPTIAEAEPQTDISSTGGTNAELPPDVTVQPGDTLWSIAWIVYGDGHQWTKIAQANNLTDPNVIHPGNLLSIPR